MLLYLDENPCCLCSLSDIAGNLLLTGKSATTQTGHNDFAVRTGQSPGYFLSLPVMLVEISTSLRGFILSQTIAVSEITCCKRACMMEEVEILPSSLSVGHEHVQRRESERLGSSCIRFHTYLALDSYDSPASIAFAYEKGVHTGCRAYALSVEKAGGTGVADVSVQDAQNESSEDNDGKNS